MARELPEWIGTTDDTPIPPRVRLRVWERAGGRCQGPCSRKLAPGDGWSCDHVVALINGGQNRESNLAVKCDWCHKEKTASDVEQKSATYERALRHAGIKRKPKGRPFPCGRDSPFRKKITGEVVRR